MIKLKFTIYVLATLLYTHGILAQNWSQIGSDIDGEAAGDLSGISVSLSSDGNTVAIGALHNSGNGASAGHVRVFNNNEGTWKQVGSDIDGESNFDNSGESVSLSDDGSVVAIGAIFNADNGSDAGHVRIFRNMNDTWVQIGSDIDGKAYDYFGLTVSLNSDGSVVAIGGRANEGNIPSGGVVRIYENLKESWIQVGSDIVGEANDDQSGYSISLSDDGNTVAIGALYNDGNGSNSGHVRVYKNIGNTWTQVGTDIDGAAAGDFFGSSVSLNKDGNIVAIGAVGNNSGHVKVYENIDDSWTQIGSDLEGDAEGDLFGRSVALSDDGSILLIGARFNDGNGTDAGHVRIYKNMNGTWTQVGSDIEGEAAGDNFGTSVSINGDGSVIAIGASLNNDNGDYAGHVRVYNLEGGSASTEAFESNIILIYPNPVTDLLTVNGISKTHEFQITDLSGKELLVGETSNNSIDVGALKDGIYLLQLENQVIQFIKE